MLYFAIDMGGTAIKYGLVNEDGELFETNAIPSPGKEKDIDYYFDLIDSIITPYLSKIDGIGISSPGIIDSEEGIVKIIGQFPYLKNQNVVSMFEERYHLPTCIENDAKCAALAEVWKGNLKDVRDGAVFIIGTAIGGGLVLDGKLRRGKHFFAGEYSGMCIDLFHQEQDESYQGSLGYPKLSALVKEKCGLENLSGKEIFALLEEGKEGIQEALEEYCDLVAMALFNLNLLLDLDVILIGGGISRNPRFIETLQDSMQKLSSVHPDIKEGVDLPLPNVDTCKYFNDSNLIGAVYHLLEMKEFSKIND